jgi:methylglyoxal reductase
VPICQQHDIAVLGYSSLALGLLAGPIDPQRHFQGDDQRNDNPRFAAANRQRLNAFFAEIEGVRARLQCSFAQLLIAWTTAHGRVTVALCGARNAQQAVDNAGATRVQLSSDDLFAIESAADRHLNTLTNW